MCRIFSAFVVFFLCVNASSIADEPDSKGFGIYLVKEALAMKTFMRDTDLSRLALETQPFIGQEDLAAYNWRNHELKLKASSLKRVMTFFTSAEGIHQNLIQPFVIVADGERIYLGMFVSALSSFEPFDLPVIMMPLPGFSDYSVIIRKASGGIGEDVRDDPRIRKALLGTGVFEPVKF